VDFDLDARGLVLWRDGVLDYNVIEHNAWEQQVEGFAERTGISGVDFRGLEQHLVSWFARLDGLRAPRGQVVIKSHAVDSPLDDLTW
jgi:hypothetical protein